MTLISNGGFALFDRHARDLPGVERLSIFSAPVRPVTSYAPPARSARRSSTPMESSGRSSSSRSPSAPYSTRTWMTPVRRGHQRDDARRTAFGNGTALGNPVEVDGRRFRVVGVVEDVSSPGGAVRGLWVPHTTAASDDYRTELRGNFNAIALAPIARRCRIREESIRGWPASSARPEARPIIAPFRDPFRGHGASVSVRRLHGPREPGLDAGAGDDRLSVLFILLPTVNLVNITSAGSGNAVPRSACGRRSGPPRIRWWAVRPGEVVLTAVGGLIGSCCRRSCCVPCPRAASCPMRSSR